MMEWNCTVEAIHDGYQGDIEDLCERVSAWLGSHHGASMPRSSNPLVSFEEGRIEARFVVTARLVLQATELARKAWMGAIGDGLAWSIVALSVRRGDQPDQCPPLSTLS